MMAYDSKRSVHVLFGGRDKSNVFGDTWEWNGKVWTKRTVINPPARWLGAMCYDPSRSKCVLYGGVATDGSGLADTWEYDGTRWVHVIPNTPSPGTVASGSMVFNPDLNVAELMAESPVGNIVQGDYAWDGKNWTYRDGNPIQPPRNLFMAQAYDPLAHKMVLFGGSDSFPTSSYFFSNNTILRDETGYNLLPSTGPFRTAASMVYDSDIKRTVLFGGAGFEQSYAAFGGMWEFDGANWAYFPSTGPHVRYFTCMTYDSARKAIVMFGGSTAESGPLGDTWEWTPDPNQASASLTPSAIPSGMTGTLNVYLQAPAGKDGAVVNVSFGHSGFSCPPTVSFEPGEQQASVEVTAPITATILSSSAYVTFGNQTQGTPVRVIPPYLKKVSVSPASIKGGEAANGTVVLGGRAPTLGESVSLSTNSSAVVVPQNIVVSQGLYESSFPIQTKTVSETINVTVTAKLGSITRAATLTVNH